jgi:hypothetical protein
MKDMCVPTYTTLKGVANLEITSQRLQVGNRRKHYVSHPLNVCGIKNIQNRTTFILLILRVL